MDKVLYIEGELLSPGQQQPTWFFDSGRRLRKGHSVSLVVHFDDGDIEQDDGKRGGRRFFEVLHR